jgi:hypothetical protein
MHTCSHATCIAQLDGNTEHESTAQPSEGWACLLQMIVTSAQLHTHHHLPFPSHPALKPAGDEGAQAAAQEGIAGGPTVCQQGGEHGFTGGPAAQSALAASTALLKLGPIQRLHASLLMSAQLCDAVGPLLCGWVPPQVLHREMKVGS